MIFEVNVSPNTLLFIFVSFTLLKYFFETYLSFLNRSYYLNTKNQNIAKAELGIDDASMQNTLRYASAKYHYSRFSNLVKTFVFLAFLILGGFGYIERLVLDFNINNSILNGLCFFGLLSIVSMIFNLPFDYYFNFILEEKFGYNKQDLKTFIFDRIKGIILAFILGGLLLSIVLWIMQVFNQYWWVLAWIVISLFSLLTAWIYPTLIAPLFNKFSPITDKDLLDKVNSLSDTIGFKHAGISVMNASKRSAHGNAYFTGIFGKKKIVLFDTLLSDLKNDETIAVLAHELGHFKLNHVRYGLLRSIAMTGLTLFIISRFLHIDIFYNAFAFSEVSNFAGLLIFSMWFGLIDFFINPIETYISRKNEFSADKFATNALKSSQSLITALLKLREKSNAVPISHPLFSFFYYSHPPMLERIMELKKQ